MTEFFGRLLHHPWALGLGTTGLTAGIIMLQHHVQVIIDAHSTEDARTEAGYALAGDCALVVSGLLAYGHAVNNAYNEWCEQQAAAGGAHGGGNLGHDGGGHDGSHHDGSHPDGSDPDGSHPDGSDHETIEMGQLEEGSGQGGDNPDAHRLASSVTTSSEAITTLSSHLSQEQDALPQLQILIVPDSPGGQQQPTLASTAPTGQGTPAPSTRAIRVDSSDTDTDTDTEEHLTDRRAEPAPGMTQTPPPLAPPDDTKDTPPPLAYLSSGEKGPGGTGADTN